MDFFLQSTFSVVLWHLSTGVTMIIILAVWWKRRTKTASKGHVSREIRNVSAIPLMTMLFKTYMNRSEEQLATFDLGDFLLQILAAIGRLYSEDKIIRYFWAGQHFLICCDPTVAAKIFQSPAAINKDWMYRFLHVVMGEGLVTSEQKKWKTRRKMINPAFHSRVLGDFLPIYNQQSKILVERLKLKEGEIGDISREASLFTLDVVIETAMGVKLNAQINQTCELDDALRWLTNTFVKDLMTPWYWLFYVSPLFHFTSAGREMNRNIKITHDFARKVIRERKITFLQDGEINRARDDFQDIEDATKPRKQRPLLDLLLYYHLTDKNFTEEDIKEEVITFIIGGQDTTSAAIVWCMYLLGLYKDIQERVYQELFQIYGEDKDRDVTTEDLREMKYLECVIKETLRLYPSVPMVLKRNTEDIDVGDYIIPAKSSLLLLIYGIHHNPKVFPNPEVFDPDRFLPENSSGRHPYAFLPFSAGYRNCIGQRFAMMELKTVCSYILRNFTVTSLDHRDAVIIKGDVILRPKGKLRLVLQRR